jgi:hypothetical protein
MGPYGRQIINQNIVNQWHCKQRDNCVSRAIDNQLQGYTAGMVNALKRKTEATTEAPKEEGSEAECQRRVTCHRVQMVAAADPDDRGRVALRRGQLTSSQVEARQNRRTDSTGVTEGDPVRPYRPARKKKVTRHRPGR